MIRLPRTGTANSQCRGSGLARYVDIDRRRTGGSGQPRNRIDPRRDHSHGVMANRQIRAGPELAVIHRPAAHRGAPLGHGDCRSPTIQTGHRARDRPGSISVIRLPRTGTANSQCRGSGLARHVDVDRHGTGGDRIIGPLLSARRTNYQGVMADAEIRAGPELAAIHRPASDRDPSLGNGDCSPVIKSSLGATEADRSRTVVSDRHLSLSRLNAHAT